MTEKHLDVTVIICAYTLARWKDLQQAVESIWDQTELPYEIILVIDHNPALFALATETFNGVRVIENQEDRGLSGARNSGIAHSRGDVIAFMDEDAVASPNWIEVLLSGYQNAQVVGVGGEVKPNWETRSPAWFPEEFNWVVGCSYKGLPQSASPIRNPIGCNMSFRRESLTASGGFRSDIGRIGTTPLGCEETELAIRVRQLDPDSIYLYQPDAEVLHKVPAWRTTWKYFVRRCYAEGLSKAVVARYVGVEDGLASERRYVVKTLSRAISDNLSKGVSQTKPGELRIAGAIVAGLTMTTIGYAVGTIKRLVSSIPPIIKSAEYTPNTAGAIFIGPYHPGDKEEVRRESNSKK